MSEEKRQVSAVRCGLVRLGAVLALGWLAGAGAAGASSLEDQLAARWRGAWVVTGVEMTSDCNASYTDNEVLGRRAVGKGRIRLAPGELARVHKLELKRSRVEVLIDVDEPLLAPFEDGPFRLVEEVTCKVELQLEVPREAIKRGDVASLEALLVPVLERYDDQRAAQGSPRWNRRERGPLPRDYEAQMAEYRRWKVAQTNAAVGQRIAQALGEAKRAVQHTSDNPDYGAGLAAGMEAMRWLSYSDCPDWLGSTFWAAKRSCPSGKNRAFQDGFEDGQAIAYHLLLAERLQGCFVPAG